jgi:hypothetical protein
MTDPDRASESTWGHCEKCYHKSQCPGNPISHDSEDCPEFRPAKLSRAQKRKGGRA